MELYGWGGGVYLEGDEGEKTMIRMYYIKKGNLLSIK